MSNTRTAARSRDINKIIEVASKYETTNEEKAITLYLKNSFLLHDYILLHKLYGHLLDLHEGEYKKQVLQVTGYHQAKYSSEILESVLLCYLADSLASSTFPDSLVYTASLCFLEGLSNYLMRWESNGRNFVMPQLSDINPIPSTGRIINKMTDLVNSNFLFFKNNYKALFAKEKDAEISTPQKRQ